MTANIKNISIALFFLAATVCAINLTWNARIGIHNLNDMGKDAKEYIHREKERLEDPAQTDAIKAYTGVGVKAGETLDQFNEKTQPALVRTANGLTAETVALKNLTDEIRTQAKQEGDSANEVLIAGKDTIKGLGGVATKLGTDSGTLTQAITDFATKSGATVEAVTQKVNDERFNKILDNALRFTDEGASTVGNVELASEQLPAIAEALNKIAQTTSRFSKAYWVARILSIVVPLVP